MRVKLYISLIHCQLIRFTERIMSVSNDITDVFRTHKMVFFGNFSFTCFKKIWFNEILTIWAHFYTEKNDCWKNFDALRIWKKILLWKLHIFSGETNNVLFDFLAKFGSISRIVERKIDLIFYMFFSINCFIPLLNSNDSNFLRKDTCNLIQLITTMR